MKHWVTIEYVKTIDYGLHSHEDVHSITEVKTTHYYREKNGTLLHVCLPDCVNVLNYGLPINQIHKEITEKEFNKVLRNTIDNMGINITNHKFY